jgi:beta-glucosidase
VARDIDSLIAELTLEEKASLTAGADLWSTVAVERLGLPSVRVTDGPNGARGPSLPGTGAEVSTSACLPCGAALGATWDVELVERVGAVLGDEARTKGCRVLLAPTVNLHRSPLGGRNFESYAEDPLLAGRIAAAFVRGAQSQGVATTVKHLAGNESEIERMTADSIIDERTLRELYLLPFELAVREGGALGIMTSYNRLNGLYGADNRLLLEGILRGEWGFDGFVMTDWFAQGDTVAAATSGLDIEMPGPARFFGSKLVDAVADGRVAEASIDAALGRLLGTLDRLGALDAPPPDPDSIDRPEHRAVAREAAAASIVLLRNRPGAGGGGRPVLPLDVAGLSSLALIGPGVAHTAIMGGGSAQLAPHYRVSVLDAAAELVGEGVELIHEPGADLARSLPPLDAELHLELVDGADPAGAEVEVTTRANGDVLFFGPPTEAVGRVFSVRLSGTLVPEVGGTWQISLAQAGRARLWLDGQVVLDGLTEPFPPGPTFLGMGSREVKTEVELTAGVPVEVRAELVNPEGSVVSGVRIGARPAPPADLVDRAVAAARRADRVVLVVGTDREWESEGHDRETMDLPAGQDALVEAVLAVAPDAVVVVNAGSPVTMDWADRAGAVLQAWFGGQEMGHAVLDVLSGRTDPAGRLPTSIPMRLEHNPSFGNFPAENGQIRYGEGLLMGYRWYEARHLPVRAPFGHGLSYTRFEIGPPTLSSSTFTPGTPLVVEVTVTNVGDRRGAEVVQCYVGQPGASVMRPPKELKAFAKVWLDPGESTQVALELGERAFAHWRAVDRVSAELAGRLQSFLTSSRPPSGIAGQPGWTIDAATYQIHLGRSSDDIAHVVDVSVVEDVTLERD